MYADFYLFTLRSVVAEIRKDVSAQYHNALFVGDVEERVRILRATGQGEQGCLPMTNTVFLLKFRHLLFFGTLRAKVKCSLQFSARSFNFFGHLYFQLKNFGTRQGREVDA